MSFAVFGASMDFCLKTARKKVKMTKGFGKNLQQLTQAEWEEAVQTYAEKLFEDYATGKKVPVQISGNMTTPNAAKDFIALAKKNIDGRSASDLSAPASKRPNKPKNQRTSNEISTI